MTNVYSAEAFYIIFTNGKRGSNTHNTEIKISFHRMPSRFMIKVGSNSAVEIGEFPEIKSDQGFDLRIDCEDNSFGFFLDGDKIYGVSDIHAEYNPLVTAIYPYFNSAFGTITDIHWTVCK